MNNVIKRFALPLLGAMLVIIPVSSEARAPVTHRTTKDFKELIVKGERPEIAACMVAALNDMRTNTKFDSIRWSDDDSEAAILREAEDDSHHLLRSIRFKAQLRSRTQGGFFETWQRAEVNCEQRDEESPEVRITAADR